MALTGGNRAIARHQQDGKTLHLFEYTRRGYVRYIGQADCIGYHQEERPDRDGELRKALVFHLDVNSSPVPSSVREVPPVYDPDDTNRLKRYSLVQLRDAALPKAVSTAEPQARMQVAYYRAEAIRRYALARANGHCEGCTQAAPFSSAQGPYLECHHLHRVADGGPDHPENVVALCPNCHRRAHYSKDAASFNAKLMPPLPSEHSTKKTYDPQTPCSRLAVRQHHRISHPGRYKQQKQHPSNNDKTGRAA